MGSYQLIISGPEGRAPVRLPVHIGRNAKESVDVTLYGEDEIPEGFVQVPAGKFIYQGDRILSYSPPRTVLDLDDFFLSTHPLTCREYREFLDDRVSVDPEDAAKRVPRKAPAGGFYWPLLGGSAADPASPAVSPEGKSRGRYVIPTEEWIAGAPEKERKPASRLQDSKSWWKEDWPAFSISWEDVLAYASWRRSREDRLFTIPHQIQWEKSARGTDGRIYPWGGDVDSSFCNISSSHEGGPRPAEVGSFPVDESPYGVRGLGGNCRDVCLDGPGGGQAGWRFCCGGHWAFLEAHARCTDRSGTTTDYVFAYLSGRLMWMPRTKTRAAKV